TKRQDDIPTLVDYYLDKWNQERFLSKDFKEFIHKYDWPGNVRELKNTIKYMVTVGRDKLSFDKLPDYLKKEDHSPDKDTLILKRLYYLSQNGYDTGRRSLKEDFRHNFYEISEMEVRKILNKLKENDMIKIARGRAGTSITERGIKYLQNNQYIF
ncbi:MAG TPA: winged-helix domain-containing protein, partial [Halanaerobiales bacterium]|nr:winged-helix domain-containing protein [Halanaerobiales bacterium]